MFKSEQAQLEFQLYIEQSCYKKNTCKIDIENMVTNVTYSKDEWDYPEAYNPLEPWKIKTNKLAEMISDECYQRIYDLEVSQTELLTVMSC